MSLPTAPAQYEQRNESSFRSQIDNILKAVFRKDRDIEVGVGRLILIDTVTSARYSVTIASGVVTLVAL